MFTKDEVTLLILAKWNGNILLKMKFKNYFIQHTKKNNIKQLLCVSEWK